MNKGIFQSGSVGKCERQSDVFHHIRYANSPRAVVPQKTAEDLKIKFSLEESEKAKFHLLQKLAKEGLEGASSGVKRVAKGIKFVLFALIYVPLTFIKILSRARARVRARVLARSAIRPFSRVFVLFPIKVFSRARVRARVLTRAAIRPFSRVVVLFPIKIFSRACVRVCALARAAIRPFLSLPPQATVKAKPKPIEAPQEVILDAIEFEKERLKKEELKNKFHPWVKWTFPSIKLPKIQFPKFLALPAFVFKFPEFPSFTFKFPALPHFHWSLQSYCEKIKNYFEFRLKKLDRKKIEQKMRASFLALKRKTILYLDELDQRMKKLSKRPEKMAKWVSPKGLLKPRTVKNPKIQEKLRRLRAFSGAVKETTESRARVAVNIVSAPLVRSIERVQRLMVSVKETLHRWNFVAIVVFELSLLLLKEAIYEFE